MKYCTGMLLESVGRILSFLTLLSALVYVAGVIAWHHAPAWSAIRMTATMALLPLAAAWLCTGIGRYLRQAPTATGASPLQRRLLFGAGIVVVLAVAMIVHRAHGMYACSVDRSRNAASHELAAQRNGFEHVCEGDLARFDIPLAPLETATRDLAFVPVHLTHTPFAQLERIGGLAERAGEVSGVLYRGFRRSDGHTLILREHDLSANGVSTWRNPEDEPERINGMAARLAVMEDPSGSAISHLSWVEGRRDYELWIDANVVGKPVREQLFALAVSLPRSVPACPNEAPPAPWKFDGHGRRIDPPPPAVLTEEQFDAIADRRKRPCK